jgi:hypothetical protein
MEIYNLVDFEGALPSGTILDGSYVMERNNSMIGDVSLRMKTDPVNAPYYFSYWNSGFPVINGVVRLEVTAAINPDIRSFGIGWRIYKGDTLAIMFARINYGNDCIELVQNTDPHIWQTIVSPIPVQLRQNNPLRPFRYSLDIDIDTLTYKRVRLHDFTNRSGIADFVYPISIENIPTESVEADGMTIKIHPQGSLGVTGVAWMDNVTIWRDV